MNAGWSPTVPARCMVIPSSLAVSRAGQAMAVHRTQVELSLQVLQVEREVEHRTVAGRAAVMILAGTEVRIEVETTTPGGGGGGGENPTGQQAASRTAADGQHEQGHGP